MANGHSNLDAWQACQPPGDKILKGQYCRLEPWNAPVHGDGLFAAVGGSQNKDIWQYMSFGPYMKKTDLLDDFNATRSGDGWRTMVILKAQTSDVLGMASYMRIRPAHGSAEVGCVSFGSKLKRTREATEAMYLMMAHVFDDLGYRRYEWKCNNGNQASKDAAIRFGFTFEGVFRKDMVMKGGNRDTAWYSITDDEWPALKRAFEAWLLPDNFDANGLQRNRLTAFMER